MGLVDHPSNALSELVIGAALEVHRHLGPGLLESSYHACLSHELELREIGHQCKVLVPLVYKELEHSHGYVADIVVDGGLVIELKSVDALKPVHINQLLTYMRLLEVPAGLLINFNVPRLLSGIRRRLL